MTTFVLVPGFWLGAWAWRPVTAALRGHGHDVYPLSLTGLGERAHLARPDTDLDVHVTDVVNLLRYEALHDVVLVGHSYAGTVVTAAADRMTDRIAQLVYVDTGPLPDGVAQEEVNPPPERERNAAMVADHGDGWRLPPPPWAELAAGASDVDESTLALLGERSVAQPWATATSPGRGRSCPASAYCRASPSSRYAGWPPPCRCAGTWPAIRGDTKSCRRGTGRCSAGQPSCPRSCTKPGRRHSLRCRVTAHRGHPAPVRGTGLTRLHDRTSRSQHAILGS